MSSDYVPPEVFSKPLPAMDIDGPDILDPGKPDSVPDEFLENKNNDQSMDRDAPSDRRPYTDALDLLGSLRNTYRILDLISEQGSGGLVEKVIIDQASLECFINDLCPGAYTSLTKVDFGALDALMVKPVGIYGSKERIVSLLQASGAVEEPVAHALRHATNESPGPKLRSGLYVVRSSSNGAEQQIFVVYWPEDTTWNDDAVSAVKRNRVTFMRYLTKITDHVVCLISSSQAQALVWKDNAEEDMTAMDLDDDNSDRLFTFEVSKTNEQEENVQSRPGFTLFSPEISTGSIPAEYSIDATVFRPKLIAGETCQAFLTSSYIPPSDKEEPFFRKTHNVVQLKSLLGDWPVQLTSELSEEAIGLLYKHDILPRYPREMGEWKKRKEEIEKTTQEAIRSRGEEFKRDIAKKTGEIEEIFRAAIVRRLGSIYPNLDLKTLKFKIPGLSETSTDSGTSNEEDTPSRGSNNATEGVPLEEDRLSGLLQLYPQLGSDMERVASIDVLKSGFPRAFKIAKEDLILTSFMLGHCEILGIDQHALLDEDISMRRLESSLTNKESHEGIWGTIKKVWSSKTPDSPEQSILDDAKALLQSSTDTLDFLAGLESFLQEPLLRPKVPEVLQAAERHIASVVSKEARTLAAHAGHLQEQACMSQLRLEAQNERDTKLKASRSQLIEQLEIEWRSERCFVLKSVELDSYRSWRSVSFIVSGTTRSRLPGKMEYTLHAMDLSADHKHELQMRPDFVPLPRVEPRRSHKFQLPLDCKILFMQLLINDRCLLVVNDSRDQLAIYLERPDSLDGALSRRRARKSLHHDKIGTDIRFAYDEIKRMLVLCASSKFRLHIFVFDETFSNLQTWGNAVDLALWYSATPGLSILQICWVCGNEEVLLIDNGGQARIFSLVTQQFRPATLVLDEAPLEVHSSPDGACLILVYAGQDDVKWRLRTYHWTNFGSAQGFSVDVPHGFGDLPMIVTSMVNRNTIHMLSLDVESHQCKSLVLDITKKVTEFQFKERYGKDSSRNTDVLTIHNSLLDCHPDVWTRFPVIAAIQRRGLPRNLTFATDRDYSRFKTYFADMIQSFEQRTRKPTSDALSNIAISSLPYDDVVAELGPETSWGDVDPYRAGEWLVDILCLIPIHIAVTRENRFVPLKDGVVSAELERSLLGAEVGTIVDSLSLGWYESIFQSYMAEKPVRVVSSMGEQSVGKSYMLNHLADSSFAGSAMRTTEGVWLSVTPADGSLIVALDFEGVHSIERSAQEDTLLVLFNTAISNLVLFRNNFALSRNITGLFQSFQSSSTVLDPAANPSLFQSTLVIIIKDVVDSDKKEIVKEFQLKFQKIVQDEQDANFISRLHAGQLNIVPWPVIESKQFYTIFPTLRKRLDQQEVTHPAAGEFLLTLKTLMAKLKANDWGAMSQTLVAHRAQRLRNMLQIAMSYGFAEIEPEPEPLKNFDTDKLIESQDTHARLCLAGSGTVSDDREKALSTLRDSWDGNFRRHNSSDIEWISALSSYLKSVVNMRIAHVQDWIDANLSRFKAGHANIEALRREFEMAKVDALLNVELCKMSCASCQLLCIGSQRHHSDHPHDCGTSHQCPHPCEYADEHMAESSFRTCGYPAGHSGKHICAVDVHLCGSPCQLGSKKGCLGECTKMVGHSDDHMCSATIHACGEPCDLQNVDLGAKRLFSCPGTCSIPSHEEHLEHRCDNRMCPIQCELCGRLCSQDDHLHGLEASQVHLCGQVHSCKALCTAEGICQIDTAPQSIEATFTGRHETFQYTKYSQVNKRLQCAIPIPAGKLGHTGTHCHSTDPDPFHFCEVRCESCGYFCTLPRGHPQQDHETSHGSMSKTRWAVDGPEGTSLELNGRQFASDDDGAPMMCNLICKDMGRHAHLDYCRAGSQASCASAELEHISTRLTPHPERPKDWISHRLYWMRSGFKDPYSRDDQTNFGKCDAMCPGPEHTGSPAQPAQPSYCTLPIFHPRPLVNQSAGLGYVSQDGHIFACKNPVVMQQAFHVVFVIDRSGSMGLQDRRPLQGTPVTSLIARQCNDRLGAVYSALYAFWESRQAALNSATAPGGPVQQARQRRDSYSILFFDDRVDVGIANDFTSSPRDLLNIALSHTSRGGTNYTSALRSAQSIMQQHWSTERTPVVIFLSDGECSVADETVQDLCRAAIAQGNPLSFHTVSFGSRNAVLQRMAQIALQVQTSAPPNANAPAAARIDSSYSQALDTVRLAETFLGIAESLRKPRGSLMH